MTALARRHRIARELRVLDPRRRAGRKTNLRIEHRRLTSDMPDYTLFMTVEGQAITFRGKRKDYVEDQARLLLRRLGIPRHQATLRRDDDAKPAMSGTAMRKGEERRILIEAGGNVVEGTAMRMLPLFAT